MAYKTKYKIQNPSKYIGDSKNIICRSMWERRVCRYMDENKNVIRWGSEELIIPYYSPIDKKNHKYYPDFIAEIKSKDGDLKTYVIEVKPKKQTKAPKPVERKTKRWINEVKTFGINEAKWKHASKWCKDNDMEFKILTEDDLGIRYK